MRSSSTKFWTSPKPCVGNVSKNFFLRGNLYGGGQQKTFAGGEEKFAMLSAKKSARQSKNKTPAMQLQISRQSKKVLQNLRGRLRKSPMKFTKKSRRLSTPTQKSNQSLQHIPRTKANALNKSRHKSASCSAKLTI